MKTRKTHKPDETITDSLEALRLLKEGNARYVSGKLARKRDMEHHRQILTTGQHPFVTLLCCSDSRSVPELIFDQRQGDIFVVRNAGNVANHVTLGSIEYAVEHLETCLVVVMGHSKCGAVTAAYEGMGTSGNLKTVTDKIRAGCAECDDVDDAIHANIRYMAEIIRANDVVAKKNAVVAEAYLDLGTGIVTWL